MAKFLIVLLRYIEEILDLFFIRPKDKIPDTFSQKIAGVPNVECFSTTQNSWSFLPRLINKIRDFLLPAMT